MTSPVKKRIEYWRAAVRLCEDILATPCFGRPQGQQLVERHFKGRIHVNEITQLRLCIALVLALFLVGSSSARVASEEPVPPFAAGRMPEVGEFPFETFERFLKDQDNHDSRLVGSSRGDELTVVVLYWKCSEINLAPQVAFSEVSRKTRLEEGFEQLKGLRRDVGARGSAEDASRRQCVEGWVTSNRRLVERRASLAITAEMADEAASNSAGYPNEADWLVVVDLRSKASNQGKHENLKRQTIKILTGPREPWLLSAAIPLNDVNQLKYDSSSMEIKLKEETKTFYVSLDYTLGDALLEQPQFCQALTFKLLFAASKDPLRSVGAGIGLMPGWFSRLDDRLKIFDTLSPWVGFTFSEQDELSADGSVSHGGRRNNEFRVGVSLSLTEVSGWFKKGE